MSSYVLDLREGGGHILGEFILADEGFEPPAQSGEPSDCSSGRALENSVLGGDYGSDRSRPLGSPALLTGKGEATLFLPLLPLMEGMPWAPL